MGSLGVEGGVSKAMGEWLCGWPLGPVSSLGFRLRKEWRPWESPGEETILPQELRMGLYSGSFWDHLPHSSDFGKGGV